MDQRSEWVDYAKAIGIVLVVYGHVARGIVGAGMVIPQPFYDLTDSIIYSFHMPLFFFLSGLFFYHSLKRRGSVGLVVNKVDTIFYPFVLWSILQGSIEVFLANYTNGDLTFREVLSFLWAPRAHFWFLYALFFCFIFAIVLTILLGKVLPDSLRSWAAYLLLIVSVVVYLHPSLLPGNVIFRFLSENFVFFIIGIVFSLHSHRLSLGSTRVFISLLVLFLLAQYGFHILLGKQYSETGVLSLLLALISIAFIIYLSARWAQYQHQWVVYIGLSSMAIYLMHILAGSGIRVILQSFLNLENYYVHLILGTLVGILAPLLALIIIEKLRIPFLFSAPISKIAIKN